MRRSVAIIIGVVAIAVVLGAVFLLIRPIGPPPREKSFTLTLFEFGFNQARGGPDLRVKVGDTVKITLSNKGGMVHNFFILTREVWEAWLKAWDDARARGVAPPPDPIPAFAGAAVSELKIGETRTITFVADKAGSYVYVCSKSDPAPDVHARLGMIANFIVEP